MGTEFSRRVNAWIAVSGATRDPLLAPIAQCGKSLRREGLERKRLSRYDSYSVEFYNMEDLYFREYPYRVNVSFCRLLRINCE